MSAMLDLRNEIMDLCYKTQEDLGDNNAATVTIVNALMEAYAIYAVQCTTRDPGEGQKRFSEFSLSLAKAGQEFFAKYTGEAAVIELQDP